MIDKLFFGYSAAKRHNLAFYEAVIIWLCQKDIINKKFQVKPCLPKNNFSGLFLIGMGTILPKIFPAILYNFV